MHIIRAKRLPRRFFAEPSEYETPSPADSEPPTYEVIITRPLDGLETHYSRKKHRVKASDSVVRVVQSSRGPYQK